MTLRWALRSAAVAKGTGVAAMSREMLAKLGSAPAK